MPAACPECGAPYGDGFEQNYGESRNHVISYCDPKTLGQQADLNARKMGATAYREECERFEEKNRRPVPWYRQGGDGMERLEKPLDLSKIKDVDHFIQTGEKG